MTTLLLIALVAPPAPAAQAAESAFEFGPWYDVEFAPSVTATVEDDGASVYVALPLPVDSLGQHVERFEPRHGRGALVDHLRKGEPGGELLRVGFEVYRDEPAVVGYTAHLRVRAVRLRAEAANLPADRLRPTPSQRVEAAPWLALQDAVTVEAPAFASAVARIAAASDHPLQQLRAATELVADRLRYRRRLRFKGAADAWQDGVGECGDYSALLIGALRRLGIPARPVAGFVLVEPTQEPTAGTTWAHHVWVEAYLGELGWVPCDPTLADGATVGEPGAAIGTRPAGRVALCRQFDVAVPGVGRAPLVQEYVARHDGFEAPTLKWELAPARLEVVQAGDRLPNTGGRP